VLIDHLQHDSARRRAPRLLPRPPAGLYGSSDESTRSNLSRKIPAFQPVTDARSGLPGTRFGIEDLMDELAHAAKSRTGRVSSETLASSLRHRAVLELAAAKADWRVPANAPQGVAVDYAQGGWAAQIAEISISPDTVATQVEGATAYGLTAALNRDHHRGWSRRPNRFWRSQENPSGGGECGVPPAVANAVFAATGKHIRSLPIRASPLF
jgi:isoquinoline 1-oxidoreductase beta subunit